MKVFLAFKRQSIAAPGCRLAWRRRPHNSQPSGESALERLRRARSRGLSFAHRFNYTRPHQALGDLTPAEYLSTISQEVAPSHMG